MKTNHYNKYLLIFILFYGFSYMCNLVYSSFISIYLNSVGFNKTNIGILTSLAPIVAILGQPLWGTLSDRAKSKNTILKTLLLGSAVTILFYRTSTNFFYLSFIITAFTFFQTSINPMTDALTLEYIQKSKWKFGHIRLAGTVGYSIMAILAGMILTKTIDKMFILYFILTIITLFFAFLLPNVKGHQSKEKRTFIWNLFKDRKLLAYIIFALMIQITLGFYNTFFSIYYEQLGASRTMIGWAFFISAVSEVPFLLFAHVILKKAKTHHALLFAGAAAAIRWLLLGLTVNNYLVLLIQSLHGLIYIVISVSMATYINKSVPNELKASGQALNALFGTGIARVIGSLLGGFLSDIFGIRNMFVYNSLFCIAAVIIFGIIFSRKNMK
jgi:PPP family 3-phenylpropionic acid transporter